MRRYCSARRANSIAHLLPFLTAIGACTSTSQQITGPPSDTKCAMQVALSESDFSARGGEGRVTVTTERDCRWSVQSSASWVTVKASGETQGSGAAAFAVAPTEDPLARSATLTVSDQQVAITQRAAECRYRLSVQDVSVPAAGGAVEVDVTASSALCEWTVQTTADWVSITSGRTYKGSGRVAVQATPWTGPPRRAEIVVADQRMVVTQADGCAYSLTASSIELSRAGGRGAVSVQAGEGCGWSAVSTVPWIHITAGATAAGPGVAEFSVDPNSGPARSAALTIASRRFTVAQASGCEYRIEPPAWTFAAAGGPGAITMNTTTECSWTAQSEVEWIALISGLSGSGPGVVQISVSPNAGPERAGAVRIGGQRFVATQASACVYSIEPAAWTFSSTGGPGAITVNTAPACPWTAASQAEWMIITAGASGVGPGVVWFTVAPNLADARSGTLTIAGQTFVGHQNAVGP
jgi:hypothetical protein